MPWTSFSPSLRKKTQKHEKKKTLSSITDVFHSVSELVGFYMFSKDFDHWWLSACVTSSPASLNAVLQILHTSIRLPRPWKASSFLERKGSSFFSSSFNGSSFFSGLNSSFFSGVISDNSFFIWNNSFSFSGDDSSFLSRVKSTRGLWEELSRLTLSLRSWYSSSFLMRKESSMPLWNESSMLSREVSSLLLWKESSFWEKRPNTWTWST